MFENDSTKDVHNGDDDADDERADNGDDNGDDGMTMETLSTINDDEDEHMIMRMNNDVKTRAYPGSSTPWPQYPKTLSPCAPPPPPPTIKRLFREVKSAKASKNTASVTDVREPPYLRPATINHSTPTNVSTHSIR